MFNFSKHEKAIIAFLFAAILIGSLVHYYKIKTSSTEVFMRDVIKEEIDWPKTININTAGEKDLVLLEGIGPALAERIIAYRNTNGLFTSKEDIIRVKGIGAKKFDKIKDSIGVQ